MSDGSPAVVFDGAGKRFDETWVLEDVDLEVPAGTIIGLIGPSGSGKTTLVRLINGVYAADAGTVRVLGEDPTTRACADRTDIGYLPQSPVLFSELSLWENLNFHASMNGVRFRRRKRLEELLQLVDLHDDRKKLVRESSGGMQRRLALAATMVHDPKILILDEPTAGIDPILRRRFWDQFRTERDEGTTLVITTQFVDEAALCDVVGMLANGRVMAVGSPLELRRRAFGGDQIDLEFEHHVESDLASKCEQLDGVVDVKTIDSSRLRATIDPDLQEVRSLVDEASAFGNQVVAATEVPPNWDEVFIALVGSETAQ